jgi:hypothetical protein
MRNGSRSTGRVPTLRRMDKTWPGIRRIQPFQNAHQASRSMKPVSIGLGGGLRRDQEGHRFVLAALPRLFGLGRTCQAESRSPRSARALRHRYPRASAWGSWQMASRDCFGNHGFAHPGPPSGDYGHAQPRTRRRRLLNGPASPASGASASLKEGHRPRRATCFGRTHIREGIQTGPKHQGRHLSGRWLPGGSGQHEQGSSRKTSPHRNRWTGRPRRSLGNGAPSGEGAGRVKLPLVASATGTQQKGGRSRAHGRTPAWFARQTGFGRGGQNWAHCDSQDASVSHRRVLRHHGNAASKWSMQDDSKPSMEQAQGSIGRQSGGNVGLSLRT